jgi:hypothetical protein
VFCGTISEGDLAYTEQKKSNICDDAGRTNDGSNDEITCMVCIDATNGGYNVFV